MDSESGLSSGAMRLHELKPGEQAVILAIHGETRAVARIHSLGLYGSLQFETVSQD